MLKKIQTKLAAIFVVTVCVAMGGLFVMLETGQYDVRKKAFIDSLNKLVDLQAIALSRPVWELDATEIDNLVTVLAGHPDLARVLITEPSGTVLAEFGTDRDRSLVDIKRTIRHTALNGKEEVIAELVLTFSLERFNQEWVERIKTDVVVLIVIATVLLSVTLIATNLVVAKPLQRLIQSMERQRNTGRRETVQVTTDDEVGTLIDRFNDLTAATEQATQAAEQKSELLNTVLENMSEGLTMVDQDLNLLTFNRRYLELTGLPEGAVKEGAPFADILRQGAKSGIFGPGEPDELIQERLQGLLKVDGTPIRRKRPNGSITEMRRRKLPDGRIVTTHVDITELQNMQNALLEAKETAESMSRSKSDFLALMSHELRTPLNSIIGFSEVVANETFGKINVPKYAEYAGHIYGSGRHLLALINDILDLSKIESGTFQLNHEEITIHDVLDFCITMVTPRAQKQGLDITVNVTPNMPHLKADLRALRQVILNILSNAVKFTPEGGQISITAGALNNGEVIISVQDTGIGISEADIMRVLEPFGQAREGQWTAHEGTGLGLPLARRLVEMHDGRLTLESRVDKGTTLTLTLPPSRVIDPTDNAHKRREDQASA